jgi:hypothetical protein
MSGTLAAPMFCTVCAPLAHSPLESTNAVTLSNVAREAAMAGEADDIPSAMAVATSAQRMSRRARRGSRVAASSSLLMS